MDTIYIEKISEAYIRIRSERSIEQEISEYFTFEVPGAKFTPKYKAKIWDGKIRLYNMQKKTLYAGLYGMVVSFAEQMGYQVEVVENELFSNIEHHKDIDDSVISQFIQKLNIHSRGKPIEVYDYQVEAFKYAIENYRGILLSPTASGKSLIIYLIVRWLLLSGKKILLIVPTTALVDQMYSDFADYASQVSWDVEDHAQKLYSGQSKNITKSILISTWQSIYKNDSEWFSRYDAIIGDEVHLFKSTCISSILEKSHNASYRIGTTGTLDKSQTNKLVLTGLFGEVKKVISTRELIDSNRASDLDIKCLVLNYPEEMKKVLSKYDYQHEMEWLETNYSRNKFIANLAINCTGNTLILTDKVERHAKPLLEIIKKKAGSRKVFAAFGNADIEDIRSIVAQEKDAIIVASYKKLSTGSNIPSIENIIFGSPSKSIVRILQSIGRGLRLNVGKSKCNLFDLIDNLSYKKSINTTLNHGTERIKIYSSESFNYRLIDIAFTG